MAVARSSFAQEAAAVRRTVQIIASRNIELTISYQCPSLWLQRSKRLNVGLKKTSSSVIALDPTSHGRSQIIPSVSPSTNTAKTAHTFTNANIMFQSLHLCD
jgi:hypothetical protein